MDHVAILRKAKISKGDNLLGDILAGTKTIESRWYVNKTAPWDKVHIGDTVYFKESGCPVTAKANVAKVLQYENWDARKIEQIIKQYGNQIAPATPLDDFLEWGRALINKKYCILVFLDNVEKIEPFEIDKTGYGISSAWLVVEDITKLQKFV